MSQFKKGAKVAFTTSRGRSGSGTVTAVENNGKGDWYSVKDADGKISKLRLANLRAA